MRKFIDISNYNQIINYVAAANSDLRGFIIKASEGTTFTDGTLNEKYENLKGKANIGFYHYLTSTSEPETQAEHFWGLIKDKQYNIRPILDIEGANLAPTAQSYAIRFLDKFRALSGIQCIIYGSTDYIKENFTSIFCAVNDWWIAEYNSQRTELTKCINVVAWQYTSNCRDYNFIDGDVDCSILYDESKFFISTAKPQQQTSATVGEIAELQMELNRQGFRDENGNALDVDNIAGKLTLSACPLVKIGASGNITRWIQKRLVKLGYNIPIDGDFGKLTLAAVKKFQFYWSLFVDGEVGENTWRRLLGL